MKFLYKPLGLLFGVLGGLVASRIFDKVWGLMSDEPEAPDATTEDAGWGEVLVAVTLQGAVFGLTKALIDRGGATAFQRMTGVWPGSRRDDD